MGKKVFRYTNEEWWPVFVPLTDGGCYKRFHTVEIDEKIVEEYVLLFQKFSEVRNKLHDELAKKID